MIVCYTEGNKSGYLYRRKGKDYMAGIIIYLVISFLTSLIFVVLGISQYKSEKPVSLNTGEKPPCEDELTDVLEWNRKHGKNLIIYGCVLFLTLSVFVYFIEKYDYIAVQINLFILVILHTKC